MNKKQSKSSNIGVKSQHCNNTVGDGNSGDRLAKPVSLQESSPAFSLRETGGVGKEIDFNVLAAYCNARQNQQQQPPCQYPEDQYCVKTNTKMQQPQNYSSDSQYGSSVSNSSHTKVSVTEYNTGNITSNLAIGHNAEVHCDGVNTIYRSNVNGDGNAMKQTSNLNNDKETNENNSNVVIERRRKSSTGSSLLQSLIASQFTLVTGNGHSSHKEDIGTTEYQLVEASSPPKSCSFPSPQTSPPSSPTAKQPQYSREDQGPPHQEFQALQEHVLPPNYLPHHNDSSVLHYQAMSSLYGPNMHQQMVTNVVNPGFQYHPGSYHAPTIMPPPHLNPGILPSQHPHHTAIYSHNPLPINHNPHIPYLDHNQQPIVSSTPGGHQLHPATHPPAVCSSSTISPHYPVGYTHPPPPPQISQPPPPHFTPSFPPNYLPGYVHSHGNSVPPPPLHPSQHLPYYSSQPSGPLPQTPAPLPTINALHNALVGITGAGGNNGLLSNNILQSRLAGLVPPQSLSELPGGLTLDEINNLRHQEYILSQLSPHISRAFLESIRSGGNMSKSQRFSSPNRSEKEEPCDTATSTTDTDEYKDIAIERHHHHHHHRHKGSHRSSKKHYEHQDNSAATAEDARRSIVRNMNSVCAITPPASPYKAKDHSVNVSQSTTTEDNSCASLSGRNKHKHHHTRRYTRYDDATQQQSIGQTVCSKQQRRNAENNQKTADQSKAVNHHKGVYEFKPVSNYNNTTYSNVGNDHRHQRQSNLVLKEEHTSNKLSSSHQSSSKAISVADSDKTKAAPQQDCGTSDSDYEAAQLASRRKCAAVKPSTKLSKADVATVGVAARRMVNNPPQLVLARQVRIKL